MANEVTTTSADDLVYAERILEANIIDALYENNNAMGVVRYASIAGFPSKTESFPKTPKLSAASLTEGTDMSYTAFATTDATITVAEVGITLTPTDLLSVSDIVQDSYYAREAGKAVANKITTDIAALGSGFSTAVGATTVDLTEANILAGIATLEAASVPGPYAALIHPQQKSDLVSDIGTTINAAGNTGLSSRAETQDIPAARPDGMLGDLFGVDFYVTAAVPTANAAADRSGMLVSKERALGFVEKWPARVELERDATLRATEIVVTSAYGVGEIDDTSGVEILSDA